ncbi:hypothetical protein [Paraburkholderia sp. HD33-4]|uniref:hypothetical protein n=1 Tax=Paraburkholderia sp. HD33-4 TaxID=2883242 RepID=UPI001F3D46CC|nr:hypothetical protein [Paraburkholderia sp. HD33-4]
MGHVFKIISGANAGKGMYCFSSDLLDGCRVFAHMAASAEDPTLVLYANTGAIFFAGSYVEARLNELIEQISSHTDSKSHVPIAFWRTLNDGKKSYSTRDKWNLIASASGGQVWDSGTEPFQSLDILTALRNELIHYKGEIGEGTKPRLKKLQYLSDRFKGPGNDVLQALKVGSWAHDLLTSEGLGQWVCEVIAPVAKDFDELLSGKKPEIMKASPSFSGLSGLEGLGDSPKDP